MGTNPMEQRFTKGVFQARPALPRYQKTWDTSIVLSHLKTLHPLGKLTLQQLTHKLVMLCALVTGQRSQSLHLMDLSNLSKTNDSYVFHIDELIKQSAPTRTQPTLVIPSFPADHSLCVASTLEEYIRRTAPLRHNETQQKSI